MSRSIHPLLFTAFPVLFLVAHNRDVTDGAEALVPLGLATVSVVLVQLVAGRLTHAPRKVAIVLSVLAMLFFSYGHVWAVLQGRELAGMSVGRDVVLGPLWVAVAACVVVLLVRTRKKLADLTRTLNIVAIVLAMTTLVTLGTDVLRAPRAAVAAEPTPTVATPSAPRDVYYLIFDRYGDEETLRTHLGFDNSDFTGSLRNKGFVVAPKSFANYQNTHLSLASSLNMKHLGDLGAEVDQPSSELRPVFDRISRNKVGATFQAAGYKYIHVGGWTSFSAFSEIADVNFKPSGSSEFTRALYGSTALSPLLRRSEAEKVDPDIAQRDTIRGGFAALDEAIAMDGPKFVFAHFILPHPPYVFDRDGDAGRETNRNGNVAGYLEQVRYANQQIDRITDELLSGPDSRDPIVIVQADEGPYPRLSTHVPGSWDEQPDRDLRVKFGILNAYYLPGEKKAVYPTISPVNTFRVVLNRYFDARLALLDDESYVSRGKKDVYTFIPITQRLHDASPEPFRSTGRG